MGAITGSTRAKIGRAVANGWGYETAMGPARYLRHRRLERRIHRRRQRRAGLDKEREKLPATPAQPASDGSGGGQ